jgi:hypothetical protein
MFSTPTPGTVFTAQIQPTLNHCQTPGIISYKTKPDNWTSDSSIIKTTSDSVELFAYPNPAVDFITVGARNNDFSSASFKVTDISGRFMDEFENPDLLSNNIRQTIDVRAYA